MENYFIDAFYSTSNLSIILTFFSLLIGYCLYCVIRDNGVPPGPTGLPYLGYWPFLNAESHLQLQEMKKKYGEIFSFRATGKLFIHLASSKTLREAHITKSDCFSKRFDCYSVAGHIFEGGVVFSNGDKWKTVRNFFLQQFKERGMGYYNENTADTMNETISSFVDELRAKAGHPVDILEVLIKKSNNIIRQTLLGPNSTISEHQVDTIRKEYKTIMFLVMSTNLVLMGKIAKYLILPFLPNYKEALNAHGRIMNFFLRTVKDHDKTFDEENIRDVLDEFILERNRRRAKDDPTAEYFSDEALAANIKQFVGDAVFNGSTFVSSVLKSLLDHPEEQEKIYNELMEVCGDRNPTFADRSKLRYTNAFLQEALRTVNFVPLFPSLECTEETTINGYRIPKGAITVMNIYSIHNDPQLYENPAKFDPSRFLSKKDKPKFETPVAFGVGKRVCLGESFVVMQSFLFCTAIVKNFKMSYPRAKTDFELIQTRTLEIDLIPRK